MVHNPKSSRTTGLVSGVLPRRLSVGLELGLELGETGKHWGLINATARHPVQPSLQTQKSRHTDLHQAPDVYLTGLAQALTVPSTGAYRPLNSKERRCCFALFSSIAHPSSLTYL